MVRRHLLGLDPFSKSHVRDELRCSLPFRHHRPIERGRERKEVSHVAEETRGERERERERETYTENDKLVEHHLAGRVD